MAFTGELEQLHIVDILQLIHTTRKSGIFAVRGSKGESRIIFSNGYIVGASHLNGSVRIGTVLVKMKIVSREEIEQALDVQKRAGKDRKPLLATLIELGKLKHEDASKGLRKLIEITLVELIGWTKGTFTLDTDEIPVTPECSYPVGTMEQEMSLDVQMVLMDALRVFDERERDRQSGAVVVPYEEEFGDVVSQSSPADAAGKKPVVTADDLGLSDLDRLERKMPESVPTDEVFDPVEIHRQKIKETLAGFSPEEQETFVSFLERSTAHSGLREGLAVRQENKGQALVLFSEDELIKHSIMTRCKNEGVLVFATDGEDELDRIIAQCLSIHSVPILALDCSDSSGGMLSEEKIGSLRRRMKEKYPRVPILQMSSALSYATALQSYHDGIRAVLPRPSRETRKTTFIADTMLFLETFRTYLTGFYNEQRDRVQADNRLSLLKDRLTALRDLREPTDVFSTLLQAAADVFERTATFIVRSTELFGDKALGIYAEKREGPTSAGNVKIPLGRPSVFRDVIESGRLYCGESNDVVLKEHLFGVIGEPLKPFIFLLPLKAKGKVIAVTYGDFGAREATPVQLELFEIMAQQAGAAVENVLYRKQLNKAPQR